MTEQVTATQPQTQPQQTSTSATETTSNSAAPAQPQFKSAAEKAASDFGQGVKPKLSWDELDRIASGQTDSSAGGQPAADGGGRQAPTGAPASEPVSNNPAQVTAPEAQAAAPAQSQSPQGDYVPADVVRQLLSQAQQAPQAQPQPQGDDIPTHIYDIPQELMTRFNSQDPLEAKQALTQYTSLVGRTIHRAAREDLAQAVKQIYQSVPQIVAHIVAQQQQTKAIHEDFYGSFKDLATPELKPIVLQTAMMIAQRDGHREWNSKLRDDTAAHVYRLLGRAQAQPVQQQAPVRPPAMMGTGARPAAPQVNEGERLSQEILGVFGR